MQIYDWASNKVKLQFAMQDLKDAQKKDPSIVIDEDTIKAAYLVRCGKLLNEVVLENVKVPEVVVEPQVEPEVVADVEYEVSVKEVKKSKKKK